MILEDYKSEDSDVFNFINVKQTPTCISTSGDLAYFSTVVGKVKMSGYWCHWRNSFPKGLRDESHSKRMLWTIELMNNSLNTQIEKRKNDII